jgi:hypothetical protein
VSSYEDRKEAFRHVTLLVEAKARGAAVRFNASRKKGTKKRGPHDVSQDYALFEVAMDLAEALGEAYDWPIQQGQKFLPEDPDGKCSDLMTPYHPRWREFCERLEGPEGINARKVKGKWRHDCDAKTLTAARRVLKKMRLSKKRIERSCQYFMENGGYCDCEVLMNVDAALSRTGLERLDADLNGHIPFGQPKLTPRERERRNRRVRRRAAK